MRQGLLHSSTSFRYLSASIHTISLLHLRCIALAAQKKKYMFCVSEECVSSSREETKTLLS